MTPKRPGADYLKLRKKRPEHRVCAAPPSGLPTEGQEEPPPIGVGSGLRGRSTPPGCVPRPEGSTRNFGLQRCECRCGGGQCLNRDVTLFMKASMRGLLRGACAAHNDGVTICSCECRACTEKAVDGSTTSRNQDGEGPVVPTEAARPAEDELARKHALGGLGGACSPTPLLQRSAGTSRGSDRSNNAHRTGALPRSDCGSKSWHRRIVLMNNRVPVKMRLTVVMPRLSDF